MASTHPCSHRGCPKLQNVNLTLELKGSPHCTSLAFPIFILPRSWQSQLTQKLFLPRRSALILCCFKKCLFHSNHPAWLPRASLIYCTKRVINIYPKIELFVLIAVITAPQWVRAPRKNRMNFSDNRRVSSIQRGIWMLFNQNSVTQELDGKEVQIKHSVSSKPATWWMELCPPWKRAEKLSIYTLYMTLSHTKMTHKKATSTYAAAGKIFPAKWRKSMRCSLSQCDRNVGFTGSTTELFNVMASKKYVLNKCKCMWSYYKTEGIQTTATWSVLRCKTNSYPWNYFFRNKGQLFWQLSNKIIPISDLSETEQNLIKSSKCVQLPVTLKFHF